MEVHVIAVSIDLANAFNLRIYIEPIYVTQNHNLIWYVKK